MCGGVRRFFVGCVWFGGWREVESERGGFRTDIGTRARARPGAQTQFIIVTVSGNIGTS